MNRRFRLLGALGVAAVLSTFMLYTALAGGDVSEPVVQMGDLPEQRDIVERQVVQLEGVAAGPVRQGTGSDDTLDFRITSRDGRHTLPVAYSGSVPDAFKVGRNVLVKGTLVDGSFQAKRNSLVTKCPSKFQDSEAVRKQASQSGSHESGDGRGEAA